MSTAVVLVGGPTKGTRFRPLSFNLPKPMFPLAGRPMLYHPVVACKKIPDLKRILVIGFYDEKEFGFYCSAMSNELNISVRHVVYLKEEKPHGSAGGLLHFKDVILEDNPENIFVINCDVCSSFPLAELLEAHHQSQRLGTILVKRVSKELAQDYGELVADPTTNELLHYTEKPETFVSDLINCGVYVFSSEVFNAIQRVASALKDPQGSMRRVSSFNEYTLQIAQRPVGEDYVRIDQEILTPLAGKKQLYVYKTEDFWEQIKNPGVSLKCSELYLSQYMKTNPQLLAKNAEGKPAVAGNVFIHPSAKIHPTAKIGPNVSISANARIGAGVRLINCIVLDDVDVKENACVMNAIVGWKSSLGKWARVQGSGNFTERLGVTILGEDVLVSDEVVVANCILLPHKEIRTSVANEIIL
eukprot:jgi/Chlat1/1771/Chrsp134S02093